MTIDDAIPGGLKYVDGDVVALNGFGIKEKALEEFDIDIRFGSARLGSIQPIRGLHSTISSPPKKSSIECVPYGQLRFRPPFSHSFIKRLHF